jgi:tetratricopeptide (TPR) repeat protein
VILFKYEYALTQRAELSFELEEYHTCIGDLTALLELKPKDTPLLFARAAALANAGQTDDAIADCSRALEIDDTPQGRVMRGTHLLNTQKYEEAYRDFSAAIDKDPTFLAAYLCRATCRAEQEKYDEACLDLTEAIRIQPDQAAAYFYRGRVKWKMRDFEGALRDVGKVIELAPGETYGYMARARAWEMQKEYAKAAEDYLTAASIDPKDPQPLVGKGRCWQALGRYDSALAAFDQAIAVDAECAAAWQARARLRATCLDRKFRDADLAMLDAKRACVLTNWQDVETLMILATASAQAGDLESAMMARRRVVDIWEVHEMVENAQRLPAGEEAGNTERR